MISASRRRPNLPSRYLRRDTIFLARIVPHDSHVTHLNNAPSVFVPGFKFDVNRDTNVVTVLVRNETEEARALAPKKKYLIGESNEQIYDGVFNEMTSVAPTAKVAEARYTAEAKKSAKILCAHLSTVTKEK